MFRVDYLGDTNDAKISPTPKGFNVSPFEVVEIVRKHEGRKKTVDDLYVDEQYYYVCDGFNGSKPQTAIDHGVKINGQTGEIYDRKTKEWLPDPRIVKPESDSEK